MALFNVFVLVAVLASTMASTMASSLASPRIITAQAVANGSRTDVARAQPRIVVNGVFDAILAGINTNLPASVSVPTNGVSFVSNCTLYGLDGGFVRDGDATAVVTLTKSVITAGIKASTEIGLLCDYAFSMSQGTIKLKMLNLKANLVLTVATAGPTTLDTFKLANPSFKLVITGMGFMGWLITKAFGLIAPVVTGPIVQVLQTVITSLINTFL